MESAIRQASDQVQSTQAIEQPLGGSTCRGCGSSLARDQRYCLTCGGRNADSRVPFDDALGEPAQAAVAAPVAAKSAGAITPALAAALVCLSVLFLGTGVLIGRSNESTKPVAAAAPQVVTVPEGGASADTGAAAAAGAGSAAAAATPGAAAKSAAPKYVAPKVSAKVASDSQKMLACSTQKTQSASCAKLAAKVKTVVTPGTPPPTDGKAPAGGAAGQTFG